MPWASDSKPTSKPRMKSLLLPLFAAHLFVGSLCAADLQVAEPKTVRFGWAQVPDVNLFNHGGLPAVPFTAQ